MQISARNQLNAKVVRIHEGTVNAEVTLELDGGQQLVSIITLESARRLGLSVGKPVVALVKASDVLLGVS